MIYGKLDAHNFELDFLPVAILDALSYLKKCDFNKLENKKYAIEGDKLFMVVNEFETKSPPDKKAEQHRQYIDVHYVIAGKEAIGLGYADEANTVIDAYDPVKDRISYGHVEGEVYMPLLAGMFVVFFPSDIHRPELQFAGKEKVRKAIIKISVDLIS